MRIFASNLRCILCVDINTPVSNLNANLAQNMQLFIGGTKMLQNDSLLYHFDTNMLHFESFLCQNGAYLTHKTNAIYALCFRTQNV